MKHATLKSALLAGVIAVVSNSTALAIDFPLNTSSAGYIPAYDWTGLYVGGNVGFGWGESDHDVVRQGWRGESTYEGVSDHDGFVGGAQVGYNYQTGNVVYGIEADLSFSGIGGDDSFDAGRRDVDVSSDIDWFGTIRGRAGVTYDRFLVYATGGVAFGGVESTYQRGRHSFSESDTRVGWTVGAGVEAFITPNLTAKIEYLHIDLGEGDLDVHNLGRRDITGASDASTHVIRAGLNYRFSF